MFRGFFWGLLRKKSLGEILFKMLPTARNIFYHRNLDGIYTDVFGVAWRLEIFGGNLFKEVAYARNNLKFREEANKIFKKISTENALEYLAFGKDFIMDRLRLEFLEQREQRINLKIYSFAGRQHKT